MINNKTKTKTMMENKSKIPFTTLHYCIRRKSYIVRPYTFYLPIHTLYATYTNKRTNPIYHILNIVGIAYLVLFSHPPKNTYMYLNPSTEVSVSFSTLQ